MGKNNLIELSVIIPAYNREKALKECLTALVNQDYPSDKFEIIIIDDGSGDGTSGMADVFMRDYGNIKYVRQLHKGPAAARNLGIREASAEITAFTDSDCIPESSWARKIVQAHTEDKDAAIIGGLTMVDPRNIKAMVSQSLSDGAMSVKLGAKNEFIFFPTCNVSFKKKLVGEKFDEAFPLPAGEDLEFFWRAFKKGCKFKYRPEIIVTHNCHLGLGSFLRQAFMYGRGNYLAKYIHPGHPLLKELVIGGSLRFLSATLVNYIKIPRFTYIYGTKLIRNNMELSFFNKAKAYLYFMLHKIIYLSGTMLEHRRLKQDSVAFKKNPLPAPAGPPEFIILDITHRCNLACNICQIHKDKSRNELLTEEVKKLIAQAKQWKVRDFVLSGGEAFLRADIFEILDFVEKNDYHVGVLTNGVLLTEDFIGRLLPYLAGGKLSLSISLDSVSPSIHDDIRGRKGCFDATINALNILFEKKRSAPNINYNTISIILNENLEELPELARLMQNLSVNSIQFQPLLSNNLVMKERSDQAKYWIPPERYPVLDQAIDSLIEFKRMNPLLVRNSEKNLLLAKKYFRGILSPVDIRCRYADKAMLIADNGFVTTCFSSYGDIRKNGLEKIHISEEAEDARNKALDCKNPCLLPCFTDYEP